MVEELEAVVGLELALLEELGYVGESAGDAFLLSSTIDSIKRKYPDFDLYVACEKKYWNILEGNPNIKGLLEWHDSMYYFGKDTSICRRLIQSQIETQGVLQRGYSKQLDNPTCISVMLRPVLFEN